MAKSDGCAYFRRPSMFWITTIVLSFGYYTFAVFWPEQLPMEKLGLLGSLSKYLLEHHYPVLYNGWWLAWLVHVFEALYSMKVCSDKGVDSLTARGLWFLQTFLFGFASLNLLLKYRPDPDPNGTETNGVLGIRNPLTNRNETNETTLKYGQIDTKASDALWGRTLIESLKRLLKIPHK